MQFFNFPLTSILGQRMGKTYETNAEAAAEAIAKAKGKVYVHCYLGVHRAKYVADLVAKKKQLRTLEYSERTGERSEDARTLDRAEAEYNNGNYQKAQETLSQIEQQSPAAQLLRGWSSYKLRNIAEARAQFTAALETTPPADANKRSDALNGLGYCALSDNDLTKAQEHFTAALKLAPEDRSALMGLSLAYYRQQSFAETMRHLETLLALDPENQEAKDLREKINKAQVSGTIASPK